MNFLKTALESYAPSSRKKRKLLKRAAINYYYLARSNVSGLWAAAYNDSPYGKKLYEAIVQQVTSSSARCAYCQDKIFHNKNLNIDHILPTSVYPRFTFKKDNLVVTCVTCNSLKSDDDYFNLANPGTYYPGATNDWACFHPIHHSYADHIDRFIIQTNHIHLRAYIGKTPAGISICTNLLSKVSEFETKSVANPKVAQAIGNLGNYMANYPIEKTQALKNIMSLMTANI